MHSHCHSFIAIFEGLNLNLLIVTYYLKVRCFNLLLEMEVKYIVSP